ncbi:ABC transporter permease [Mucilaginibacter sp. Bleaf8]|uniref:ABC transporter permease n=1 Tax=Mucilaginibacter sp. Bleaf8 TaxID=2834430 RepID=UPI001BCAD24A|nr:ABC transporter permease [Mucilaginibacter sp. Bleaf8]MBS7564812.1 ABC transporter permease [Mucilaginibacter sp. Bleaf8]
MFKNYITIAWRNLMKSKVFSFINIFGLTIGITVCMMIFLLVENEFSMDRFHHNGDQIYRVMRHFNTDGKQSDVAYLSGLYAPALLNDYKGEVEKAIRVNPTDNLITIGTNSFHEKKVLDTDPEFFSFFSFPLITGNKATALANPQSVVLTETTAKKYFGSVSNALGKTITVDKALPLTVTAVAKDVPGNSHLDFNLVIPLENYKDRSWMTSWINNGIYTYVQLAPATTKAQLEKQLPQFMDKYMGALLKETGFHFGLSLIPLKKIYFENASFDSAKHGDKTMVYVFLSIAILILLIACINFMNLSTIRATERSKEVGIRKVMGALRNNLIRQFIGESLLLTAISCLIAVGLLELALPWYNQLLDYSLEVSWNRWPIYTFLFAVMIIVGVLAGCYPALFLSAFSPIQALKGKLNLGKSGSMLRQVLVVIQFSVSVFLIIGVMVITKQMRYVKNKQLGYNQEQTVIVPVYNDEIYNHLELFKNELQNDRHVQSVSVMSGVPGGYFDRHNFDVQGHQERLQARTEFADFEFVKTLGLKVIAGRNFSAQFPTDSTDAVLINQTAAAKFGWTPGQAVGKWIKNTIRDGKSRRIVGVVSDFNYLSLKENIDALVISPAKDPRVILIKLQAGNIKSSLTMIKNEYSKLAPAYPLEYHFLDQQFNELYQKDLRQQTVLTLFAGLAIFVACLGLFGLASFTATKRFKEIGIRKVLGSSVSGIVILLSKNLLKPVLISMAVAIPIGYLVMDNWLQNFAYRTSLPWWVFFLSAVITLSIALLTISFKAAEAALTNPVKSLRGE